MLTDEGLRNQSTDGPGQPHQTCRGLSDTKVNEEGRSPSKLDTPRNLRAEHRHAEEDHIPERQAAWTGLLLSLRATRRGAARAVAVLEADVRRGEAAASASDVAVVLRPGLAARRPWDLSRRVRLGAGARCGHHGARLRRRLVVADGLVRWPNETGGKGGEAGWKWEAWTGSTCAVGTVRPST